MTATILPANFNEPGSVTLTNVGYDGRDGLIEVTVTNRDGVTSSLTIYAGDLLAASDEAIAG